MKKISIKGNYNQVSLGDINNFYISRYSNIDHKLVIDSKNIFSKKLTMIITEITKYEKDFGIEDISDILEYDSLSELTCFINSDYEPSNKFLEYFASKMCISSEWMRFSRSYIFNYPGIRCLFVSELYELLLKEDFEKMYFLTSDAKERDNIYVDLNKFKRSIKTNRTMDEIKNGLDSITITSPDKIIEKKSMLTKLDIVNYYKKVSVRMMPFLNNRLISTIRYPNGNSNDSFFKKHFENNKYLGKKVVISNKKKNDYYFIKDLNGLMYEVQMNSYEFHIWSSNVKAINKPDIMVFDLDPDEKLNINKVRDGVMCLKNVLDQLGLKSFLKTSGGKGYHVFVPFTSFESWSSFSLFAKNISLLLEEKYPDMFTCNMSKEKRKNKIFIDWYRNKKSSTSVAPYSLRIRKKITVSMPIKWSELYKIKPGDITIDIAIKRLKRIDPWKDFFSIKQ